MILRVARLGPIIGPGLHPSIGTNIQGPSLIRAPDWLPGRLGAYHLYFADHKGGFIRLAYADALQGPWRVHPPGSLHLAGSGFLVAPPPVSAAELAGFEARYRGILPPHEILAEVTTPHVASPDVHVDEAGRRIVMYVHGLDGPGHQVSRVAESADGVGFTACPGVVGPSYMRVFRHRGAVHALAMPGILLRLPDGFGGFGPGTFGLGAFEAGPTLFCPDMRHAAVLKRGNVLWVFWTRVGDAPERILLSRIDLAGDWHGWRDGPAIEVLRPVHGWEGASEPLLPSIRGTAPGFVNQLRDPAVFEEGGRVYLLYALGGESGIALARVDGLPEDGSPEDGLPEDGATR